MRASFTTGVTSSTSSWSSLFSSWILLAFICLHLFLPRRIADLEVPMHVGVDAPVPAASGTWQSVLQQQTDGTSTTSSLLGGGWYLDTVSMRVIDCTAIDKHNHTSGLSRNTAAFCAMKQKAQPAYSNAPPRSLSSSSVNRSESAAAAQETRGWGPRVLTPLLSTTDASSGFIQVYAKMGLVQSKLLWMKGGGPESSLTLQEGASHDAPTPTTTAPTAISEELATTTAQISLSASVGGRNCHTDHDTATTTAASTVEKNEWTLDARLVLRDGLWMTSPLYQMRFFGGRRLPCTPSDGPTKLKEKTSNTITDVTTSTRTGTSPTTHTTKGGAAPSRGAVVQPSPSSSSSDFIVFGMMLPMIGKAPTDAWINPSDDPTLRHLLDAVFKTEALNATGATRLFEAALEVAYGKGKGRNNGTRTIDANETNSEVIQQPLSSSQMVDDDVSIIRTVSPTTPSSSPTAIKDDEVSLHGKQRKQGTTIASSECFWYGRITTTRRRQSTTTSLPASDDLIELRYQHDASMDEEDAIVSADLYSTCGDHITWVASSTLFDSMAHAWNALSLIACVPLVLLATGVVKQYVHIRNSRTRALRMSRYIVLIVITFLFMMMFFCQLTLSALPVNEKMLNVLYALLFVDIALCVGLYAYVEVEHRGVDGVDPSARRPPMLMTYFLTSLIANLFPLILRTRLFSSASIVIAGILYWLPQAFHVASGAGRDGLVPMMLIGASSLPVTMFMMLLMAPAVGALTPHPSKWFVVFGMAEVVLGGLLLHVGHRMLRTVVRLAPRKLVPWVHVYPIPKAKLMQFAGLAEDPDCSICGESFQHPEDPTSDTARDAIWVTPCKHLFHQGCLSQWMEQRMDCPLCRATLPEPM